MPIFPQKNMQEMALAIVENAESAKPGFASKKDIERIVDQYDEKYVGSGCECVVVSVDQDRTGLKNEVVVALAYDSIRVGPAEARELFYMHRIMAELFPHNFPRFHSSYGSIENKRDLNATVRQRVTYDFVTGRGDIKELNYNSPYPFDTVMETVKELDLPLWLDTSSFDGRMLNFVRGVDGGVYYLDKLCADNRGVWKKDAIVGWMTDHGYSDQSVRIVEKSIDRLESIGTKTSISSFE